MKAFFILVAFGAAVLASPLSPSKTVKPSPDGAAAKCTPVTTGNAISNGDFQNGLTNWNLNMGSGNVNFNAALSNTYGLQDYNNASIVYYLNGKGGGTAYLSQTICVTPGQQYLYWYYLGLAARNGRGPSQCSVGLSANGIELQANRLPCGAGTNIPSNWGSCNYPGVPSDTIVNYEQIYGYHTPKETQVTFTWNMYCKGSGTAPWSLLDSIFIIPQGS